MLGTKGGHEPRCWKAPEGANGGHRRGQRVVPGFLVKQRKSLEGYKTKVFLMGGNLFGESLPETVNFCATEIVKRVDGRQGQMMLGRRHHAFLHEPTWRLRLAAYAGAFQTQHCPLCPADLSHTGERAGSRVGISSWPSLLLGNKLSRY